MDHIESASVIEIRSGYAGKGVLGLKASMDQNRISNVSTDRKSAALHGEPVQTNTWIGSPIHQCAIRQTKPCLLNGKRSFSPWIMEKMMRHEKSSRTRDNEAADP